MTDSFAPETGASAFPIKETFLTKEYSEYLPEYIDFSIPLLQTGFKPFHKKVGSSPAFHFALQFWLSLTFVESKEVEWQSREILKRGVKINTLNL